MAVGLGILLADQTSGYHPNHSPWDLEHDNMIDVNLLIVRPVIKLSRTMIIKPPPPPPEVVVQLEQAVYCYLKSCHLCHKNLQPEDDIYMYKGDQGYCTEECRSKQIKIDKAEEERRDYMKNLALRKQHRMMSSQQSSGKCNQTTILSLRDLRHGRRKPVPLQRNVAIFF